MSLLADPGDGVGLDSAHHAEKPLHHGLVSRFTGCGEERAAAVGIVGKDQVGIAVNVTDDGIELAATHGLEQRGGLAHGGGLRGGRVRWKERNDQGLPIRAGEGEEGGESRGKRRKRGRCKEKRDAALLYRKRGEKKTVVLKRKDDRCERDVARAERGKRVIFARELDRKQKRDEQKDREMDRVRRRTAPTGPKKRYAALADA